MRSLVPAGLNILILPAIVSKGGLTAVGLWGIYNLVIGLFMLGDLGVSQHVSRSISSAQLPIPEVRQIAEQAVGLWLLAILALLAAVGFYAPELLNSQRIAVGPLSLAGLAILILAGFAALVSNLLTFMHISAHQVHHAQLVQVLSAVVQFCFALVLLQFLPAYFALVVALAMNFLTQAAGMYLHLRYIAFEPVPRRVRFPTPRVLWNLFRDTKGFAMLGAAQQLFLIVNRFGVLTFGGTAVLGAFEIASRIPFLLEQAFSNGLQPLFAIFASADWRSEEGRLRLRRLIGWTNALLVITSVGCMAAWIALCGPVIGLWLNLDDPDLIFATKLFGIFNAVRAFNAITFWAAQARGSEGWIGSVYMAQAGLFLAILFVLSRFIPLGFPQIAVVITVLSILSELIVMAIAQARFRLFTLAIRSARDLLPYGAAIFMIAAAWALSAAPVKRPDALKYLFGHSSAILLLWLIILLWFSSGNPVRFLKRD